MKKEYKIFWLFFLFAYTWVSISLLADLKRVPIAETAKFTKPSTLEINRSYFLGIQTTDKIKVKNYYKKTERIPVRYEADSYDYHIAIEDINNHEYLLFFTPFCHKKVDNAYCENQEYEYYNIEKFFHSNIPEYIITGYADNIRAILFLALHAIIFLGIIILQFFLWFTYKKSQKNICKIENTQS